MRNHGWPALVLALFTMSAAVGCAAAPARDESRGEPPAGRSEPAETSVPVLINGEPVSWRTLTPLLAEDAGRRVVDELALEAALERTLRARGLTIGDAAIDAERSRWLDLLEREGVSASAESEIRRRRGLGPERFRGLLWRNAALRALIDPAEIEVQESEILLAREIRAGERFAVSGLVLPDAGTAARVLERARTDPGGPAGVVWVEAAERGLTPWHAVVSPADPQYPDALRRAVRATPPGQAGGVVALGEGYAIVLVHAVIPASPLARHDDASLRREIEVRKTRLAMERLAESLVSSTSIGRLDRHLFWDRAGR
jgi:hypothetical protein